MATRFSTRNVGSPVQDSPVGPGTVTAVGSRGLPWVDGQPVTWLQLASGAVWETQPGVREAWLKKHRTNGKEKPFAPWPRGTGGPSPEYRALEVLSLPAPVEFSGGKT